MPLPAGLTPKTVTVGMPTRFNGQPATGSATLTAPKNLVHTPTGTPLFSGSVTKQFTGLSQVEFTGLVATNAPGLNRVDWTYTLTVRVNGAAEQPEPISFVLLNEGPDTIDADTLVSVPSSAGTPVSVAVMTSVAGLTGAPTATQVVDAIDDTLGARIGVAGNPLGDAARAAYLPRLSARSVPGEAGLPKLMDSPPTISGALLGATSSIPGAIVVPAIAAGQPNVNKFTFRGGPWAQAGAVYPDAEAAVIKPLTAGLGGMFPHLEFLYYGTAFEFAYKGQGTLDSRVWVDGQLAEAVYTGDTTQDGDWHRRKVTFPTAGWRRIRIDLAAKFFGLNIGPTDAVTAAPSAGDRLLIIHDSYGEGAGADFMQGYPPLVGAMLGFDDTISLSQGSAGVLAFNSGMGRPKYRDRAADWPQVAATHVLIGMSINDDTFTTAALATELDLLLTAVEALPTVRDVWVMGRAAIGEADYGWAVSRDAPMRTVAEAHGARFVSLTDPPSIWTGNGWAGSPTGVGSSDVLWGTDRVHPTNAGHAGIARTFVSRLLANLGA